MNKPNCNTCKSPEKAPSILQCRFYAESPCAAYLKYNAYLEKRRKYEKGEPITGLDTLLAQTLIWAHGKVMHVEVVKSFQLRAVLQMLSNRQIFFAERKDKR